MLATSRANCWQDNYAKSLPYARPGFDVNLRHSSGVHDQAPSARLAISYIHHADPASSSKYTVSIAVSIMAFRKLDLIHASFISLLFILALTQIGLQVNIRQDFSDRSSLSASWPPPSGTETLFLVPENVSTAPSTILILSAAMVVAATLLAAIYVVAHWNPVGRSTCAPRKDLTRNRVYLPTRLRLYILPC